MGGASSGARTAAEDAFLASQGRERVQEPSDWQPADAAEVAALGSLSETLSDLIWMAVAHDVVAKCQLLIDLFIFLQGIQ